MKTYLIIFATLFSGSCNKAKDTTPDHKEGYTKATVYTYEDSNCGYFLKIENVSFAPISLPSKYQHYSGVPEENVIYIQYKQLTDTLKCYNKVGTKQTDIMLPKIDITKILE